MRLSLALVLLAVLASPTLIGCSSRAGSEFVEEQEKQQKLFERQQKVLERQEKEAEDLERQRHYDRKLGVYHPSPSN